MKAQDGPTEIFLSSKPSLEERFLWCLISEKFSPGPSSSTMWWHTFSLFLPKGHKENMDSFRLTRLAAACLEICKMQQPLTLTPRTKQETFQKKIIYIRILSLRVGDNDFQKKKKSSVLGGGVFRFSYHACLYVYGEGW